MSWEISQELAAGSRDRSVYRKARLGSCFHNLFFFFAVLGLCGGVWAFLDAAHGFCSVQA